MSSGGVGRGLGKARLQLRRLIQTEPFEPEHLAAMLLAFEEASQELGLYDKDDPLLKRVAKTVIDLGLTGEGDPQKLCDGAIKAVPPADHQR